VLKTLIDFDKSVLNVDNTLYNSTARFPAPGLESSFVNSMLTESFEAKKSALASRRMLIWKAIFIRTSSNCRWRQH